MLKVLLIIKGNNFVIITAENVITVIRWKKVKIQLLFYRYYMQVSIEI